MSETARRAHPILDSDLDKWIQSAEGILSRVKGTRDIESIFRELTQKQETYRTLPTELALTYAVRNATCLYFYFTDLLAERTGQREAIKELKAKQFAGVTPEIQATAKFISGYAFFVMGSSIAAYCDKQLRGKDLAKLAGLETSDFHLDVGNGLARDLNYALSYYVDALNAVTGGGNLVQTADDILSVTKAFWAAVASKAAATARSVAPEKLQLIEKTTFKYGKFVITGLTVEDGKEMKIISWVPVQPHEVIGDPDVTIILRRLCDRLALYDSVAQRNPFCELGGLVESVLIDGSPGTGKTTRFKMMMTVLAARAEQVGLNCVMKTLTADQVKSEWYGKTAQLISQIQESIVDSNTLSLFFLDDIDLLLVDRDSPGTGGADKDILKALMDFFSGATTKYIGNYVSAAATNKPTGLDEAFRQRFVYKAVISGATTPEDYIDLVAQELKPFARTGLLNIDGGGYKPFSRSLPKTIAEIYDESLRKKYSHKKKGTWEDIGRLCEEFRRADPKFTGRSVRNAIQAAVAKAADFEIPEDWFTNPDVFRKKTWEERIQMLKSLYTEVCADTIMMAIEYQFNVDRRYEAEAHAKRVRTIAEELSVNLEAQKLALR